MWPELEKVLQDYGNLFQEPTTLPPQRLHDHKIVLKDGAEPVNVRPYRYASEQKDAIESLISDMLKTGVIRNSFTIC